MAGAVSRRGLAKLGLGRPLTATWAVELPSPPADVLEKLATQVAPLEGGFRLVSRVSWGGAVTRVLRETESDLPLFGRMEAAGFKVAALPRGPNVSPFQPILTGRVQPTDGGCEVTVAMAPHPGARTFAGLFALGGGMLLVAAGIRLADAPGMALFLALFAMVFMVFPTARARVGFKHGCAMSVTALRAALGAP
jgi:hypothetical protein